jgi:hypothetical protein
VGWLDSIRTLGGFSVETRSPLGFLPGFDWLRCLGLPSLERIKRSDMIGLHRRPLEAPIQLQCYPGITLAKKSCLTAFWRFLAPSALQGCPDQSTINRSS